MKEPGIIKAEAFDVMQYFYNTAQEPLVRCLVRLDGHIDECALKRAVALSAGACPLIFCRFDISGRQPKWVSAGYTADDAVHVLDAPGADTEFPEKLLAASDVDIFKEPQVKILIARGEASDALCILMSHLVCDGGGFMDYLYLLCGLYNKCRGDPGYHEELKPYPRDLRQLTSRFSLAAKYRILFPGKAPENRCGIPVVALHGDAASPFIAVRRIPAGRFSRVRASARALGATVNDALLAAYLRALSSATGETAMTLPCPVDLRKYLPDRGSRFCNLTSNLYCSVELDRGEPFGETLRKVAESMAAQKKSTACLKGPIKLRFVYPFLSFKTFGKNFNKLFSIPVTSYTNLGVLDENRFRFEGAEIAGVYLTGAIKRIPYFQVAASTYQGCCTLTCNLRGTQEDRAFIQRFLRQVDDELLTEE